MQNFNAIGNEEIHNLHKTAFLCSRKVPANIILKSYDWAIEQRDKGICIISGFHSKIEKDVFHYLIKGKQPVIIVLERYFKKRYTPFDKKIKEAMKANRLLVIRGASAVSDQDEFYMYLWLFLSRNSEKQHYSQPKSRSIASYWQQKSCWSETADAPVISQFSKKIKRASVKTAKKRNELMCNIADEIFIAHASKGGKKEILSWQKPIYTFDSDYNKNVIKMGARSVNMDNVSAWGKFFAT